MSVHAYNDDFASCKLFGRCIIKRERERERGVERFSRCQKKRYRTDDIYSISRAVI